MTTETGLPALLDEPVWYEPLFSPAWLLPRLRDGAPSVMFVPGEAPGGEEHPAARSIRIGLGLYLAEAVRFSTDAKAPAATGPWAVGAGSAAVVTATVSGEGPSRAVRISVAGGDVEIGQISHEAPDDAALGNVISGLPGELNVKLRDAGVRPVWSTIYSPPPASQAAEYVRAHRVCAWLRDPDVHSPAPESPDATKEKAEVVKGALKTLANLASRTASPLAAALFFAGLAATKANGSGVYADFRLPANSLAMKADDPRDTLYRLSIPVLFLFGDDGAAESRLRVLSASGDEEMSGWLARARKA
jgi:hypothetical protein